MTDSAPEKNKKKKPPQQQTPLLPTDTKRCKRCGSYYVTNLNTSCVYHPGTYSDLKFSPGWSCCYKVAKTDIGCSTSLHIEDAITSQFLSERPLNPEALSSIEIDSFQEPTIISEVEERKDEETETYVRKADGTIYYKHIVLPVDTLRGISIKYSVNPSTLKRINRIFGRDDEIHLKNYLLIPWDKPVNEDKIEFPNPTNDELIKLLKYEFNISVEEAKFYLSDAEWDITLARNQYLKDLEYEKNHRPNNNLPKIVKTKN